MLFAKNDKRTLRIPDDQASVFKALGYTVTTAEGQPVFPQNGDGDIDKAKTAPTRPVRPVRKKPDNDDTKLKAKAGVSE